MSHVPARVAFFFELTDAVGFPRSTRKLFISLESDLRVLDR